MPDDAVNKIIDPAIVAYKERIRQFNYFEQGIGSALGFNQTELPSGNDQINADADVNNPDFRYANSYHFKKLLDKFRYEPFVQLRPNGFNHHLNGRLGEDLDVALDDLTKLIGLWGFDYEKHDLAIQAQHWSPEQGVALKRVLDTLTCADLSNLSEDQKLVIEQMEDDLEQVYYINEVAIPLKERAFILNDPNSEEKLVKEIEALVDKGYLGPEALGIPPADALYKIEDLTKSLLTPEMKMEHFKLSEDRSELKFASMSPVDIAREIQSRYVDITQNPDGDRAQARTRSQRNMLPLVRQSYETFRAAMTASEGKTLSAEQKVQDRENKLEATEMMMHRALHAGVITPREFFMGHHRLHLPTDLYAHLGGFENIQSLYTLRALDDGINKFDQDGNVVGLNQDFVDDVICDIENGSQYQDKLPELVHHLRNIYEYYYAMPADRHPEKPDYEEGVDIFADLDYGSLDGPDLPGIYDPNYLPELSEDELKIYEAYKLRQEGLVRERIADLQRLNDADYISGTARKDDNPKEYKATLPEAYSDVQGMHHAAPLDETDGLQDTLQRLHHARLEAEGGSYIISVEQDHYDQEAGKAVPTRENYLINNNGDIEHNGQIVGNVMSGGLGNTHIAATELVRWGMSIDSTLQSYNTIVNEEHNAYEKTLVERITKDAAMQETLLRELQDVPDFDNTRPNYSRQSEFVRRAKTKFMPENMAEGDYTTLLIILWNQEQMRRDDLRIPDYTRLVNEKESFPEFHKLAAMHDILHFSATGETGDILNEIHNPLDQKIDDRLLPASLYALTDKNYGNIPETVDVQSQEWQSILKGTEFEGRLVISKHDVQNVLAIQLERLCQDRGLDPKDLSKAMLGGNAAQGIPPICPYINDIKWIYNSLAETPSERNQIWNQKFGSMGFEGTVSTMINGELRQMNAKDIATRKFLRSMTGMYAHRLQELTKTMMEREEQADLSYDEVKEIIENIPDKNRRNEALSIFNEDIKATLEQRSIVNYVTLNSVIKDSQFNFYRDYAENRERYVEEERGRAQQAMSIPEHTRDAFNENYGDISTPGGSDNGPLPPLDKPDPTISVSHTG